MMITPDYCRTMARYNQWQNSAASELVAHMPAADLTEDRGAFFGSILGTLNHLLWADLVWMSRLDGGDGPGVALADSPRLTPDVRDWARRRFLADGRIREWALALDAIDLVGNLSWYSGAMQAEARRPVALCVMHMFNHQAHHRGQVHAMLTAAGRDPGPTDLFMMPETA